MKEEETQKKSMSQQKNIKIKKITRWNGKCQQGLEFFMKIAD